MVDLDVIIYEEGAGVVKELITDKMVSDGAEPVDSAIIAKVVSPKNKGSIFKQEVVSEQVGIDEA